MECGERLGECDISPEASCAIQRPPPTPENTDLQGFPLIKRNWWDSIASAKMLLRFASMFLEQAERHENNNETEDWQLGWQEQGQHIAAMRRSNISAVRREKSVDFFGGGGAKNILVLNICSGNLFLAHFHSPKRSSPAHTTLSYTSCVPLQWESRTSALVSMLRSAALCNIQVH